MTFHLKLRLPAPAPAPTSGGGGTAGDCTLSVQFFCLSPNGFADNGKRICVWIPGLQPTDVVSWSVSNTFDGGEQPAYENVLGPDGGDPVLVLYTAFAGSAGSLTFTATVNGTPLDPLTVNLPDACP